LAITTKNKYCRRCRLEELLIGANLEKKNIKEINVSEKRKDSKPSSISRREFLKDAGIIVGGAAIGSAGLLASCAGKTVTETLTQTTTKSATQTVTQTNTQVNTQFATTTVTAAAPPAATVTVTATKTAAPTTATVTAEPTSVTILNPEGQMEPIPLTPLAQRVQGGLAGKTIYVASVNFTGTEPFLQELQKLFKEKYPTCNVVYKVKEGSYAASDDKLWAEVKEKAQAFVMGVGH
jgi:hypothetical protein